MNKVILIGYATKDSDIQERVAKTSIATNETYMKDDRKIKNTEFHNVVAFGKLKKVFEYITKGTLFSIEGKIKTNKVENNGDTKYYTSIIAEKIELLKKGQEKEDDGMEEIPF